MYAISLKSLLWQQLCYFFWKNLVSDDCFVHEFWGDIFFVGCFWTNQDTQHKANTWLRSRRSANASWKPSRPACLLSMLKNSMQWSNTPPDCQKHGTGRQSFTAKFTARMAVVTQNYFCQRVLDFCGKTALFIWILQFPWTEYNVPLIVVKLRIQRIRKDSGVVFNSHENSIITI